MITQERLKEFVKYNPVIGKFTWVANKARGSIGAEAGAIDDRKYKHLQIDNKQYLVHRLIWLYMTGCFPRNEIDHINRDPSDNSWKNLRLASRSDNQKNQSKRSDNTSGIVGVHMHKPSGKWHVRIGISGVHKYIGSFSDKQKAIAVRKAAEVAFNYHTNHGI